MLISPAADTTINALGVTFEWQPNPAEDAVTAYRLVINDFNFDSYLTTRYTPADICTDTVCTVTIDTPTFKNWLYNWQVVAKNDSGKTRSESQEFWVMFPGWINILNPVTSTTPIADNTPLIEWERVPQAAEYRVRIKDANTDGSFVNTGWQSAAFFTCDGSESTCTYQVTTPLANTSQPLVLPQYFLVIQARNTAVAARKTRGDLEFAVDFPGTPSLISPNYQYAATEDGTAPQFVWTPVALAESYRLQIEANDAAWNNPAVGTIVFNETVTPACDAETCTYQYTEDLPQGPYRWRLYAVNGEFESAGNSAVNYRWENFHIIFGFPTYWVEPDPLLLTPKTYDTASPALAWVALANVSSYRLRIWEKTAEGKTLVVDETFDHAEICTAEICTAALASFDPAVTLTDGRYVAKVTTTTLGTFGTPYEADSLRVRFNIEASS